MHFLFISNPNPKGVIIVADSTFGPRIAVWRDRVLQLPRLNVWRYNVLRLLSSLMTGCFMYKCVRPPVDGVKAYPIVKKSDTMLMIDELFKEDFGVPAQVDYGSKE